MSDQSAEGPPRSPGIRKLTRREFFFGLGGVVAGAAVATLAPKLPQAAQQVVKEADKALHELDPRSLHPARALTPVEVFTAFTNIPSGDEYHHDPRKPRSGTTKQGERVIITTAKDNGKEHDDINFAPKRHGIEIDDTPQIMFSADGQMVAFTGKANAPEQGEGIKVIYVVKGKENGEVEVRNFSIPPDGSWAMTGDGSIVTLQKATPETVKVSRWLPTANTPEDKFIEDENIMLRPNARIVMMGENSQMMFEAVDKRTREPVIVAYDYDSGFVQAYTADTLLWRMKLNPEDYIPRMELGGMFLSGSQEKSFPQAIIYIGSTKNSTSGATSMLDFPVRKIQTR